jgi:BirA family transcriptional regulator, biotin operon repressor / biotin---[acetyl-CoA-carboxylase] ligase
VIAERPPLGPVALPASWSLTVVDETESTNADLLAAADRTSPGAVLLAEHQTAGRGRLDRSWTAPRRSGLTFSVLLRPDAPVATWGWLPLLAGVAVHDAVSPLVDARLKWPNDLLVGADLRKAAGILVQVSGPAVVIGIGLNVSTTAQELPVPTAASLATTGAGTVDRAALLGRILAELSHRYQQWQRSDGDVHVSGLAADYFERCATVGQEVCVHMPAGGSFAGVATGIDAQGRLRVDVAGRERVVAAGDVEHIRPFTH